MEQEMAKHEEFANFIVKSSQDAPKYLKDSNSGNSTTKYYFKFYFNILIIIYIIFNIKEFKIIIEEKIRF